MPGMIQTTMSSMAQTTMSSMAQTTMSGMIPTSGVNTMMINGSIVNSTTTTEKEATEEKPKCKYRKFSDFPVISLTNDAIHKSHPEFIESIYEFLSYQCPQCGRRYYKNEENDKNSEDKIRSHMDWHFRQNRRIKNQSKQTLCRGWQDISEDDWIESKTVEGKFTTPTFFQFDPTNAETEDIENNENKIEEIKYIPSDGTLEKCYICKEDFEKHWHEEEEEWMLKNAIKKEGKYFHPSCYSDYKSKIKENKSKEEEIKSEEKQEDTNDKETEKQTVESVEEKSKNNDDTTNNINTNTKEKRKLDDEIDEEMNNNLKENDNKKIKLE
jgi:uncharacterized Zn finger protein (UPF0148 family)